MGLNIKTAEAHDLAKELSELTGESMAAAVTTAIRERLERMRRKGLSERLMELGRQAASRMTEAERTFDYDAFLYDEETGLPK
jgi:antitoxin VapB